MVVSDGRVARHTAWSAAARAAMDVLTLAFRDAAPATLVAAAAALLIGSLLVLSLLSRTLLKPKNSPPILACMPLVGGFAKFIKVRLF